MAKLMIIVMDSVGVGALPDAYLYGDEDSNTLAHIAQAVGGLKMPNLAKLGLGNIIDIEGIIPTANPLGAYGKMTEVSKGKDTTTGHWELTGIVLEEPMPTFPDGFPQEFITAFENEINRKIIGNKVASGTEILIELGEEHMKTGSPIVYTSADSVLQIAAHEEIIPLQELYNICKTARRMMTENLAVGRIIARPFIGETGNFTRTLNRHDYSLDPPAETVLDALEASGREVIAVGKISDIFAGRGITRSIVTKSNLDGIIKSKAAWEELEDGIIFTNLVEFDSLCGHRNDPVLYAQKLEEMDKEMAGLIALAGKEGWLILTADHGNDPTTISTDHSREYVPLLVYGRQIRAGAELGIRSTFADLAATISEIFNLDYKCIGKSFYSLFQEG